MASGSRRILSAFVSAILVTGLMPTMSYGAPLGADPEADAAAKAQSSSEEEKESTGLRFSAQKAEKAADAAAAGGEQATIIVQLDDGGAQGVSLFNFIMGNAQEARHSFMKEQVRELAEEAQAEAEAAEKSNAAAQEEAVSEVKAASGATTLSLRSNGLTPQSAKPEAIGASAAYASLEAEGSDDAMEEVRDYYHAIDGFAVKAPVGTLDDIRQLDGVKNAFVEQTYDVPVDQGTQDVQDTADLKNQNALEATGADGVEKKGDGQVVAIIDTGLDTDHEAFSGDLVDGSLALTEANVQALKEGLQGVSGTYLNEKIPFAYDYADGDNDVNPGLAGLEHGTHVAGIAAANGGDEIRGTAPNAQILAMKVASDQTGFMTDTAILAAIDDCGVLLPDSVNISLGSDAGFSDGGNATYADAIAKLESLGVTVNVAAGNAYSAGAYNQSGKNLPYAEDPDSSVISTPSSVSSSLAVASVGSTPLEIADKVETDSWAGTFTAPDGTEMRYWSPLAPDGTPCVNQFEDIAEGAYDVVWADMGRSSFFGEVDESTGNAVLEGKTRLFRAIRASMVSTTFPIRDRSMKRAPRARPPSSSTTPISAKMIWRASRSRMTTGIPPTPAPSSS